MRWLPLLVVLCGCETSVLKGLEGRWTGTILCFGGSSELNLFFTLEGEKLVGTAQTRFKSNNKAWEASGAVAKSCQEDTCRSSRDCPGAVGTDDAQSQALRACVINPVCQATCGLDAKVGSCDPCLGCTPCQVCDQCRPDWLPIRAVLHDDDASLKDPELKLWRFGEQFLKGSIRDFCPDEKALHPEVELRKS